MSVAGKRVLIVGGGFAGMSTAISIIQQCKKLNIENPKIEIFESANAPEDKNFQDYSMSIRGDTGGVQVLKKLGIFEDALTLNSFSKGFGIVSHDGKTFTSLLELVENPNSENFGIRISRVRLWNLIRNHLPECVTFNWGMSAKDAKKIVGENGTEEVVVTFENEKSHTGDLLIVADGSKSRLRSALFPNENLRYAGVVMVAGMAEISGEIPAPFNRRHNIVLGDGVSLFIAHEKENSLLWGISWLSEKPHPEIRNRTATEEQKLYLKKTAIEKGQSFPKLFTEMVEKSPLDSFRLFSLYDKLPHSGLGNIIFIGDSCHPVTPFSGNGANMALVDGNKLAECLTNPKFKTISEATKNFLTEMIPRCTAVVNQGRQSISMIHTQNSIGKFFRNSVIKTLGFAISNPTAVKIGMGVVVVGVISAVAYTVVNSTKSN